MLKDSPYLLHVGLLAHPTEREAEVRQREEGEREEGEERERRRGRTVCNTIRGDLGPTC